MGKLQGDQKSCYKCIECKAPLDKYDKDTKKCVKPAVPTPKPKDPNPPVCELCHEGYDETLKKCVACGPGKLAIKSNVCMPHPQNCNV